MSQDLPIHAVKGYVDWVLEGLLDVCGDYERKYGRNVVQLEVVRERFQKEFFSIDAIGRSPFLRQCFLKPYGYSGDFRTIDMIYRNRPAPDGVVTHVERFAYDAPACRAVRNRKEFLKEKVREEKCMKRELSILNLASGPAREIAELAEEGTLDENCRVINIDHEPEAHDYAMGLLNGVTKQTGIDYIVEDAYRFSLRKDNLDRYGAQDLILCAGLFDYLDDAWAVRVLRALFALLREDGILIVGNFSHENPSRTLMEWFADWKLIHRDEETFAGLFRKAGITDMVIEKESLGVNLFGVAGKGSTVKPFPDDAA
ncbi:MAG: class I SAM-dependent methyltransferase [Deltaproteobacteria bacterium]|nr:class I SAM-dependent methyltransferase [Deltaproteobacteria bacterium]